MTGFITWCQKWDLPKHAFGIKNGEHRCTSYLSSNILYHSHWVVWAFDCCVYVSGVDADSDFFLVFLRCNHHGGNPVRWVSNRSYDTQDTIRWSSLCTLSRMACRIWCGAQTTGVIFGSTAILHLRGSIPSSLSNNSLYCESICWVEPSVWETWWTAGPKETRPWSWHVLMPSRVADSPWTIKNLSGWDWESTMQFNSVSPSRYRTSPP